MKVVVISGAPGAGKSRALVHEIISNSARYILACPRIDLIRERLSDIASATTGVTTAPVLVQVHSETPSRLPVVQQLREIMSEIDHTQHAVIGVTHDTLMMLSQMELAGWHVAIDERVSGLSSGQYTIPATARILRNYFDIAPVSQPGWGRLVARPDAFNYGDTLRDMVLHPLADIVKWAGSPHGVVVDITDWNEIEGSSRPLGWVSAWTYASLKYADSVVIAAAGLEHSLTYMATQALDPQVQFEPVEIPVVRPVLPKIFIHYFTRSHRGSSHYWANDRQGISCIVAVAKFLEGLEIGYWAANKNVQQYFVGRLSGIQVSIKVEGTNEFRTARSCALIYSAKPRFEDEPLRRYFGWARDFIERARECEDSLQFVQRGAIRCSEFSGEYQIYVYDEWQANWLSQYFRDSGIAEVEIVAEDPPGIMDIERPKSGRRADATRTSEQKAADRRARDRARKEKQRRALGIKPRSS